MKGLKDQDSQGSRRLLPASTSSRPTPRQSRYATGCRNQAPRPFHRHALLQPGADDGAGRADPWPRHQRRDTLATAQELAKALGKTPITVKNSPGFVVNRILCPMINEAIFCLQEGLATAEDIDNGMKLGTNQPIGPLALADMIGLDVMIAVMNVFYEGFNDPKYRPAPLLKEMVAAGYLGPQDRARFYLTPNRPFVVILWRPSKRNPTTLSVRGAPDLTKTLAHRHHPFVVSLPP